MKPFEAMALAALALVPAAGLYGPTPAPTRYHQHNDYVLWFVQGADTVGQPVSTTLGEALHFRAVGSTIELDVETVGDGFSDSDTFTIDESGRVLAVDGVPVDQIATPRVDVLPRIPFDLAGLAPAVRWEDEVSRNGEEDWGSTSYAARRTYTVVGAVDGFRSSALLIVGSGDIELRHGGWQDETQTVKWSQEASGPTVDSVWIDVASGRLIANTTHMDLVGTATFEGGGQSVTLPSGLRSSVRRVPR